MNIQEITRLLEKYYNGESSEVEEMALRRFFATGNVPPELDVESEIFKYYTQSALVPAASPDLEKRIISAVENRSGSSRHFIRRPVLYAVMGAAAGLLILTGSYFFFTRAIEPEDTFSDPRVAYNEAVSILFDVSSQLSRGTGELEPVLKFKDAAQKSMGTIRNSTGMIEDSLRNLDYFQRAMKMVNDPLSIGINK